MSNPNSQSSCKRCGTCCAKGGPTLHSADLHLLTENVLRPEHLVTIRAGELAVRPDDGSLMEIPEEMIKIRGKDGTWACFFFDRKENECRLYEHRPRECRIFECWAPEKSESLFLKGLLGRKDLHPAESILGELIEAHDHTCAPSLLHRLILRREEDGHAELDGEIADIVEADRRFRSMVRERFGLSEWDQEFFFGRPLKTLEQRFEQFVSRRKEESAPDS